MFAYKRLIGGFVVALLALPAYSSGQTAASYSAPDGDGPSSTTIKRAVAATGTGATAAQNRTVTAADWSNDVADDDSSSNGTLNGQLRNRGRVTVINPDGLTTPASSLSQVSTQSPSSGSCTNDGSCPTCQQSPCCCSNFWQHRSYVFGEFLYLKSYGPDFVHATQQQAAPSGVGTVPFGTAQNLIQPWQAAFRVGAGYALSDCSTISVAYTQFQSHTSDGLGLPAGGNAPTSVISSVLVPGTINAGTTFSQINATSGIAFKTADIMYSRLLAGGDDYYVNYDIGLRYAHLDQGFFQNAEFAQPNNPQITSSNIRYDGVGLRTGFDGRRRIGCHGLSAYGNGFLSVLFGDFNSNYTQTNALTTATLAANNWESARVMPILEYEVGLSWTSCSGCWRASAGYYTAFWFNAVTSPQYIQAVQNNNFVKLGDTITFTGFVAHAEMRF